MTALFRHTCDTSDVCLACNAAWFAATDADYCPECGGELAAREHGQGCGYVAQAMADHAFDHHGEHR